MKITPLMIEEQLGILHRIAERGKTQALESQRRHDRDFGLDCWQHLLDELQALKRYWESMPSPSASKSTES